MRQITLTILSIITLFTLINCSNSEQIIDYPSESYKLLAENKKLWEESEINDYTFIIPPPISSESLQSENIYIKVYDNVATEMRYIPSNTPIDIQSYNQEKTIEEYFIRIEKELERSDSEVNVLYDATYGYPTEIAINKIDNAIIDGEVTYLIERVRRSDIVCTEEYAPVCGSVDLSCATTPCETQEETFSNMCYLNNNPNATYLYDGECQGY